MNRVARPTGMQAFVLIWAGQLLSLIGSGLTGFILSIWIYQQNGSVTEFTLTFFFYIIPGLLLGPIAGALVDRWDRRKVMLISDICEGVASLSLAALFALGLLVPWQIYVSLLVSSLSNAFRWPAFNAITPLLVPKRHLGRTGGMIQFAESSSSLISPALAGLLVTTINIYGILVIDAVTFLCSVLVLLLVRIPAPVPAAEAQAARGKLTSEIRYGWRYITDRPPLYALLIFMAFTRFAVGLVTVLALPLLLTMTSVEMMGVIRSIGGVGALAGSILMSVWSRPGRRIATMLAAELLGGLCMIMVGLSQSVPFITIVIFLYFVRYPINLASSYAIWISKVAPEVQGRIFSVVRLVAFIALPVSYLSAGPLAEQIFEPLLAAGGPLAGGLVGQIVGVGPGRGIALIFIILGILNIGITALGFLYPRLRLAERELPDAVAERPAVENAPGDDLVLGPAQ